MIRRMVICPFWTTGMSRALWTPRIPTSGWLMIGVAPNPPSLPKLVIVKVEPVRSSMVAVPSRQAPETRCISAAALHTSMASTFFTTGTNNPRSVAVAIPKCTASCRMTLFPSHRISHCIQGGWALPLSRPA